MKVSLLTVPVEPHYLELQPKVTAATDVFSSIRSEGRLPIMPKIAIVSLVRWMEKNGWKREEWDYYDVDMELPDDERLRRYFRETRPDVIGLSAVVSTCYYQVKRLSRIAREELPGSWIVVGGSITASANLVLKKTDADLCAVGDGEITWTELLAHLKARGPRRGPAAHPGLEKIAGLAWLDASGALRSSGYGKAIPAADIPFPDYDLLQSGLKDRPEDLKYYFRPGLGVHEFQTDPRSYEPGRRPKIANMWTSKGCVARCTFCQRSTKGYRVPTADALDRHLDELQSRFDVGFLHILDENFGSDLDYAYEVARRFHARGILWMASGVRVSSLEREDIEFFKAHGCCSLKFGVETGSQKIMNVMEKKFTVERVYQTLKHCADLGINSPLAVMVGMPGETDETAQATGRFLGRVSHFQGVEPEFQMLSIYYALPLTGTPLYVYGQQIGAIGKSPEEEEAYLLSVSGTGASKANYVNLNGSPLRDVVFWDWLVRLEAARTFFELDEKNPVDRTTFAYKAIMSEDNLERRREALGRALTFAELLRRVRQGVPTGIRAKLFYAVDNFLEQKVIYSRAWHRLPRWALYGFVKNLVYAQFLMQRVIARLAGREFNVHRVRPHLRTLDFSAQGGKVEIAQSLRSIVKARSIEKGPATTEAERAQDLLAIGL